MRVGFRLANNELKKLMTPELETRIYKSVLRSVIWGEPRDEILKMLEVNGITGELAEALFRRAFKERIEIVRGEAARRAAKGALFLSAGIALFCIFWFGFRAITKAMLIICAALVGWGFWCLLNGLVDALLAPSKKGSVAPDP